MATSSNGGPAEAPRPQLSVLAQYIKDLSFENPGAPQTFMSAQQQPAINIQINVSANGQPDDNTEVVLTLEGKAELNGSILFAFELAYAGLFRVANIPQEQLHPVVMIECPRLLFPFAREVIATTVRNGGFPALMLEPIDFVALYQQNMGPGQVPQPAPPLS